MLEWFRSKAKPDRNKKELPSGDGTNEPVDHDAGGGKAERGVTGDSPIRRPEDDAFGVDPFAKAIGYAISRSGAREGLVYAVNGPWGSGKSSVINLVLHHLEGDKSISVATFNPWWFSGAEALTLSFFQEMQATIGKSLDERAREAMASLGSRLSSAGPLLGGLAALAATPAAGAAVTGGAAFLEKLTRIDSTVEKEYSKIAQALSASNKKFIVVIDDIDRLDTDGALQVFKLVKSVGRLPNVIYLMAFDRALAEKMVAERFPSEGISFLEKVVQGGFDIPRPDPDDLQNRLLVQVDLVMGAPPEDKMPRFWNLFHDAVAPLLKTPRDIVRLSNAITVSWPAVADDVDRADFLAIEALRLFLPTVYEAIRTRPDLLVGAGDRGDGKQALENEYDLTFLAGVNAHQQEIAKRSLRRLFPRTEQIWSRISRSNDHSWQRDRLICSPSHFRTYFAFGVTGDLITAAETRNLIASAGVPGATASALTNLLAQKRRRGGTRAALALDELAGRSEDIPEADVGQFLADLFSISDELHIDADEAKGFSSASNQLRIHWLLNNMFDRFEMETRNKLTIEAMSSSSLGWLISFSDRLRRNQHQENKKDRQEADNIVDEHTANQVYEYSIERIRQAATDGSLGKHPRIIELLFRWRDRVGGQEVRKWTDDKLADDDFIARIAAKSIRESWSHGMGGFGFLADRVATRSEYVSINSLEKILDVNEFRRRVDALLISDTLSSESREALEKFKRTPEKDPTRVD